MEVYKWTGQNEAKMREFVANDARVSITGTSLSIDTGSSWVTVPVGNYVTKDANGQLGTMTELELAKHPNVVVWGD